MAGKFEQSVSEQDFINGVVRSATRLKMNIESIIEKYDRDFPDDDLIDLYSLEIVRAGNNGKGVLRKHKPHPFGSCKLKTTRRKEMMLKSLMNSKTPEFDPNTSMAIARECQSAFRNARNMCQEPSDAETLSSHEEDDDEEVDGEDDDEEEDGEDDDEEEEEIDEDEEVEDFSFSDEAENEISNGEKYHRSLYNDSSHALSKETEDRDEEGDERNGVEINTEDEKYDADEEDFKSDDEESEKTDFSQGRSGSQAKAQGFLKDSQTSQRQVNQLVEIQSADGKANNTSFTTAAPCNDADDNDAASHDDSFVSISSDRNRPQVRSTLNLSSMLSPSKLRPLNDTFIVSTHSATIVGHSSCKDSIFNGTFVANSGVTQTIPVECPTKFSSGFKSPQLLSASRLSSNLIRKKSKSSLRDPPELLSQSESQEEISLAVSSTGVSFSHKKSFSSSMIDDESQTSLKTEGHCPLSRTRETSHFPCPKTVFQSSKAVQVDSWPSDFCPQTNQVSFLGGSPQRGAEDENHDDNCHEKCHISISSESDADDEEMKWTIDQIVNQSSSRSSPAKPVEAHPPLSHNTSGPRTFLTALGANETLSGFCPMQASECSQNVGRYQCKERSDQIYGCCHCRGSLFSNKQISGDADSIDENSAMSDQVGSQWASHSTSAGLSRQQNTCHTSTGLSRQQNTCHTSAGLSRQQSTCHTSAGLSSQQSTCHTSAGLSRQQSTSHTSGYQTEASSGGSPKLSSSTQPDHNATYSILRQAGGGLDNRVMPGPVTNTEASLKNSMPLSKLLPSVDDIARFVDVPTKPLKFNKKRLMMARRKYKRPSAAQPLTDPPDNEMSQSEQRLPQNNEYATSQETGACSSRVSQWVENHVESQTPDRCRYPSCPPKIPPVFLSCLSPGLAHVQVGVKHPQDRDNHPSRCLHQSSRPPDISGDLRGVPVRQSCQCCGKSPPAKARKVEAACHPCNKSVSMACGCTCCHPPAEIQSCRPLNCISFHHGATCHGGAPTTENSHCQRECRDCQGKSVKELCQYPCPRVNVSAVTVNKSRDEQGQTNVISEKADSVSMVGPAQPPWSERKSTNFLFMDDEEFVQRMSSQIAGNIKKYLNLNGGSGFEAFSDNAKETVNQTFGKREPSASNKPTQSAAGFSQCMFPEDYVNMFSPSNPDRIDSDETLRKEQEERSATLNFRHFLRCFRPRRHQAKGSPLGVPEGGQHYDQLPDRGSESKPEDPLSLRVENCLPTLPNLPEAQENISPPFKKPLPCTTGKKHPFQSVFRVPKKAASFENLTASHKSKRKREFDEALERRGPGRPFPLRSSTPKPFDSTFQGFGLNTSLSTIVAPSVCGALGNVATDYNSASCSDDEQDFNLL